MFHLLQGVDAWRQRWLQYPTGQAQGTRHTKHRAQCEQRERHQEKNCLRIYLLTQCNAQIGQRGGGGYENDK